MRVAHSNLQRQNTVYSHKKYVILQHLLLMRLIVDTRWAKGAKRFLYGEILVKDIHFSPCRIT